MELRASIPLFFGFFLAACGSTSAQPPARQPPPVEPAQGVSPRAASMVLGADSTFDIAGCDTTIMVDPRHAASAPGVAAQLAASWQDARQQLTKREGGAELIADLSALGVRAPTDARSIAICVPAVGNLDREGDALERAGVLIRGDFARGALLPLIMKWSRAKVAPAQYRDVDYVDVGDLLFAQRADGELVIARHASSLHALLGAGSAASTGLAVAGHVQRVDRLWSRRAKTEPFPTHAVRSLDFDFGTSLDRLRVVIHATDGAAAADVAIALRGLLAQLARDLRTPRNARDVIDNKLLATVAAAEVQSVGETVTLQTALPSTWTTLAVDRLTDQAL